MSKTTIWDRPEVAAAVQQLRDALAKTLRKKERDSLGNLLVTAVSKEKSIAHYYEGCTCPACSIFTLQSISSEVFKMQSEAVRVPLASGLGPKVH